MKPAANPAAALALLLFSTSLAACGGGGSGDVRLAITSGTDEITGEPVATDSTAIGELIQSGSAFFQRAQSSLQNARGELRVSSDFGISLLIDGQQAAAFDSVAGTITNVAARQFLTLNHDSAAGYALIINAPNGVPVDNIAAANSLDYSVYGAWLEGANLDILSALPGNTSDIGAFYGGVVTELSEMPATGTATFQGGALALVRDSASGATARYQGTSSFTANFADRRLSGNISLMDGTGATWGEIQTQSVAISGNTVNGSITSSNGQSGQLEGAFMGPDAVELAGGFALSGNGADIHGSFGATK